MGVTTEELAKMSENGELIAEDLLPPLSKELLRMANSGNQLEKAMNNTNSALNRFSNNMILSNARINEAGLDKGIRDLANSASDFLARADELWSLMGGISPVLFKPFRSLFELFGALSDKFEGFSETVKRNEASFKVLAALTAAAFGWTRKLLFVFELIPAAVSNIAAVIDGEQLTWTQWLTTLLGVLGALTGIAGITKKVGGVLGRGAGNRPPLKAAAGGGLLGGLMRAGTMKVAVVSFLGLSAFGALASLLYDVFFGAGPSAPTGQTVSERFGDNLRVGEIERDPSVVTIPERIQSWLQQPASEVDFLNKRINEFDFNMQSPDFLKDFGYLLNRSAESQAITSGDITFNITGDNSKEIADEVLRVIHSDVIRPTSLNDPSQEK